MTRREYLEDMHKNHVKGMEYKQYISEAYRDYKGFCLSTQKDPVRIEDWLNAEL